MIEMIFTAPYIIFLHIYPILRTHIERNEPIFVNHRGLRELRLYHLSICIKHEMAQVLNYIVCTFLFTVICNTGPTNWMALSRWMIEALIFPWTLFLLLSEHYVGLNDDILADPGPWVEVKISATIKVVQFVVMRYADICLSSRLNDLQTLLFYRLCHAPNLHHVPDNHPMRAWLKSVQSSVP
jgi:hypothetical protein